ncbi:MAG: EamA family transporter [Parasporobacterium sp.]|nr:EamA family transporter [Parasporobacterium sp.]
MKDAAKGRIFIILTAVLWGMAGICVKSISWGTPGIVAARSLISLIMLFAVKRNFRLRFTKVNILAALAMSVTSILYILAIKRTNAGTAIVLQYVEPILVLLFAVIFQKRKVRKTEVLLILLVFAGCVLSFADSLDFSHILGNIMALASGFTFAAQIIIMNGSECDTQDCTIISNFICFAVCIPFVIFGKPLSFGASDIMWVLVLGIFQYGAANILFSKGVQLVDKVECSLLLTIEPIFNPIPVAIFCGEKMGGLAVIGSAAVIAGVALYALLPKLESRRDKLMQN